MSTEHGVWLFFGATSLVQVLGASMAVKYWWQASHGIWRVFWLAFVVNWVFTVAHQVLWLLWSHGIPSTDVILAHIMKLGAMLAELMIMEVAQQLSTRQEHSAETHL